MQNGNQFPRYKFIDANPPNFYKIQKETWAEKGDIEGKVSIRRNTDCKIGVFKPMKESLKRRNKNRKITIFANHYGEFIASKIAEKIGIPVCKVELARKRIKRKYSKEIREVEGCISYLHKDMDDLIIYGSTIIEMYSFRKDAKDSIIGREKNNIDNIVKALEYYLSERVGISQEEIDTIINKIIEMVVFDCTFGNNDRHDDNWGILYRPVKQENEKAKLDLYPMFDNERILGLSLGKEAVKEIIKNDSQLEELSDATLVSRMGYGEKQEKVKYYEMINYLLKKYPVGTQKALNKILLFTENDLEDILENCDGLDDSYKELAKKVFGIRREKIREIQRKNYRNTTNDEVEL